MTTSIGTIGAGPTIGTGFLSAEIVWDASYGVGGLIWACLSWLPVCLTIATVRTVLVLALGVKRTFVI